MLKSANNSRANRDSKQRNVSLQARRIAARAVYPERHVAAVQRSK